MNNHFLRFISAFLNASAISASFLLSSRCHPIIYLEYRSIHIAR
jgi:hypothetical protein